MTPTYRIVPGWLLRYRLEKRWLVFWFCVTTSDSFSELVKTVENCGGRLINARPK